MPRQLTIVHTETSRGWGGQEIRILTEMRAMRDRGHHLLLAAPANATLATRAHEAGFPVLHFSDHKAAYPAAILQLTRWLKTTQPHVVNPHSSRDGWIASIAARLAKVPLLIRSRHIEVDYPNRLLSRLAFHHLPHHVLTTSQRISCRLIQELNLQPNRVTCIPTGVDLTRFNPALPPSLRSEWQTPGQTPVIAMVAVLRSWKGHEILLQAANLLATRNTPFQLILAGDGPGRQRIHDHIRSLPSTKPHQILCLGHREDVPQILASADIVVLPSTAHEGVPQILLQAQAMRRAVVGTQIGGIPEIITHRTTGLLVPPSNPTALADALQELLLNPELRQTLGTHARTAIEQHHSLEAMCTQLEAVYQLHLSPPAPHHPV